MTGDARKPISEFKMDELIEERERLWHLAREAA